MKNLEIRVDDAETRRTHTTKRATSAICILDSINETYT